MAVKEMSLGEIEEKTDESLRKMLEKVDESIDRWSKEDWFYLSNHLVRLAALEIRHLEGSRTLNERLKSTAISKLADSIHNLPMFHLYYQEDAMIDETIDETVLQYYKSVINWNREIRMVCSALLFSLIAFEFRSLIKAENVEKILAQLSKRSL